MSLSYQPHSSSRYFSWTLYMKDLKDSWTWTTVWGLTVEVRDGLGGGGKGGEHWDNCNTINNTEKKIGKPEFCKSAAR